MLLEDGSPQGPTGTSSLSAPFLADLHFGLSACESTNAKHIKTIGEAGAPHIAGAHGPRKGPSLWDTVQLSLNSVKRMPPPSTPNTVPVPGDTLWLPHTASERLRNTT